MGNKQEKDDRPAIVVWLDDKMTSEEQTDIADLIAGIIHNEWYGQYDSNMVGPHPIDELRWNLDG